MAIRQFDFNVNITTPTLPGSGGAPSGTSDLVTLGYASGAYTPREDVYGGVASIAALKAIASASRFDEQLVWVSGVTSFYEFDSASVAVGDDDLIVEPTSGTGRWIKIEMAGGDAGGGAAGIETLEQKLDIEHSDIITAPIANSVGESFAKTIPESTLWFMEDYTSPAVTIGAAVNPMWLSSSNKNFDGVTDWTAIGSTDTANINVEATTKKLGTNALSWDKAGGTAVTSGVYIDLAAANAINIGSHRYLLLYLNMPSITNFSSFRVRLGAEATVATNYREITLTTNSAGGAIGTGWNLILVDTTSGVDVGTGWASTQLLRSIGFTVVVGSAAQTYTNIVVDSVVFSARDATTAVQKGDEFSIYDTSNTESFILSSASSNVYGLITLTSALANSYSGGSAATIKRTNLDVSSKNVARMTDGLSGNAADLQTFRKKIILPDDLPSADVTITAAKTTNMAFEVATVPASGSITITDPLDLSAQWLSGDKYYVFEPVHSNGVKNYAFRDLTVTLSATGSASGGITTLTNSGSNSGVAVGDLVVKKELDLYVSLVDKTDDEAFGSALTPTDILMSDFGIPYPKASNVVGHWELGGGASGLVNKKGYIESMQVAAGPINTSRAFLNGKYGAGAFTTNQMIHLPTGEYDDLQGDTSIGNGTVSFSMWIYLVGTPAGTGVVLSHSSTSTAGNSWALSHLAAGNTLQMTIVGGSAIATTGSMVTSAWNHMAMQWTDNVSGSIWLNGVKTNFSSIAHTGAATGDRFAVGNYLNGNNPATHVYLADLVAWVGYNLTDADVLSMYAAGTGGGLVGEYPVMRVRAEKTALSGQKLSVKAALSRATDAVNPGLRFIGAIKD